MIHKLNIKLSEAKHAIAIPGFKRDDLLRIALVDLCTLEKPLISDRDREKIEHEYRRLAFLGDRLLDTVLADYLFTTHSELSKQDLDDWRQEITCRKSLTEFAIQLGLPNFCSSWNRPNRKLPEEEPGVHGEMFEALVAVIYLDGDRNFERVYRWACDRFIHEAVESFEEELELGEDFDGTITTRDYLDMIGLESFSDCWAPGDDDD